MAFSTRFARNASRGASVNVALLAALALVGCSSTPNDEAGALGGQTGGESLGCLPVTTKALDRDEVSPLGFSAAEVLTALAEPQRGTLLWANRPQGEWTVTLSARGNARYEDREYRNDGSGREIATLGCADVVVIPVQLGFSTGAGEFEETWEAELALTAPGFGSLFFEVPLDNLSGSFVLTEVRPEDFDFVQVFLQLDLQNYAVGGRIEALGSRTVGDAASAQSIPVATLSR
jgi:hypothetical protein